MLINIVNGKPAGTVSISNNVIEDQYLADNPSFIRSNFNFEYSPDYYEYDGTTFNLIAGWEALEATRVAAEGTRKFAVGHQELKDNLKAYFLDISARPRVGTGLGFDVDGSHNDLQNYQIGKDLGLLVVKDADNNSQTITLPDYDTILLAIKIHGLTLLQTKWTHQANIEALTTIAAVQSYDITTGW